MNLHRKQIRHTAAISLLGIMAFLSSCEKGNNTIGDIDSIDENTRYILQPPTVSIEPFGGSTPVTRAAVAIKEEYQAFNIGEELGNIITLGNSEAEDRPETRVLTDGTYYRIVVYKLSEWNTTSSKIHEQRLCKIGQAGYLVDTGDSTDPIYLYPGDYRIFCYSFNKTSTDKLTKLADGTINMPLSDADDFLSSDIISKTISINQLGASVALGTITLKHRCCRLIGTLTAEAFDASGILASPTPSLSVNSTFTTAGNWSIKSTSFSGTSTSNVAKTIPLKVSGDTYTGTVILLPLSGKSLTTTYTFRPNGAGKTISVSNKSISTGATFNGNGSYSFTIKAIGAYVLTEPNPLTDPIQIGKYKWAYANLDGMTKQQECLPWVGGKLNGDDNDYWRWDCLDVDTDKSASLSGSWSISNDPCRVGLGDRWQVPSYAHFEDLVKYKLPFKKVYIAGTIVTTTQYSWAKIPAIGGGGCVLVDTERGTSILIPGCGTREGASYGSLGFGYYWSTDDSSVITDGAVCLYVANGAFTFPYHRFRYIGLTIRCVYE